MVRQIELALYHCRQILLLEQLPPPQVTAAGSTIPRSVVHLTYNDLIIGYTAVTLVEFSVHMHLSDLQETLGLMERLLCSRGVASEELEEHEFKSDPVLQWATSVMRKKVLDAQAEAASDADEDADIGMNVAGEEDTTDRSPGPYWSGMASDSWNFLLDTSTPMFTFPFGVNS